MVKLATLAQPCKDPNAHGKQNLKRLLEGRLPRDLEGKGWPCKTSSTVAEQKALFSVGRQIADCRAQMFAHAEAEAEIETDRERLHCS